MTVVPERAVALVRRGRTRSGPDDRIGSRQAWLAWVLGVTVYFVAVLQRSSLGVAGVLAAHRFGVSSTALASFAMVQLLVYAGMQIPVGLMVDRWGPRRLLTTGLVIMGGGQLLFATVHTLGPALLARGLLGAGDAMTFVSVLRLVAAWFPPRRNALLVQLTALVGQTGSVVSTFPLSAALHRLGWTTTFAAAGVVSLALSLVTVSRLKDGPPAALAQRAHRRAAPVGLRAALAQAWATPWTRIGLAVHFTTQFPTTVFAMLWGFPFLVVGERRTVAEAGGLLTLMVLGAMGYGQTFGQLVARRPQWRLKIALGVVASIAAAWVVVLAWPGRAPLGVLVGLVLVMASGGPASMIGFDLARSGNPVSRLGTATGIVNIGGFMASVVLLLGIGLVLDVLSPGGPASYSLHAFRVAFLLQLALQAVGVVMVLRLRRRLQPGRGPVWRGQWQRWTTARDAAEGLAGGASAVR